MMRTKVALVGLAAVAASTAGLAVPAEADSTIVAINRTANLSPTRVIFKVPVTVTCSEDTTSASLSATVTQTTAGGSQTATGAVLSLGAFECTGEEEKVWVPVRRPTGGYRWVKGVGVTARVSNVVFITDDPAPGFNVDHASGRTVRVR